MLLVRQNISCYDGVNSSQKGAAGREKFKYSGWGFGL